MGFADGFGVTVGYPLRGSFQLRLCQWLETLNFELLRLFVLKS